MVSSWAVGLDDDANNEERGSLVLVANLAGHLDLGHEWDHP